MKRTTILLLVFMFAFSLCLHADTTTILFPEDVSIASHVNLSDTIISDIHVTYVDVSKEEWSWYKIISLLVGLIVPLSSVWLAWIINRDNNEYNLTKHKQEMQDKHDEELQQKKILKQGQILETINTLDSRCRSKDYPSKEEIKKTSDKILVAYPFLGKDLYIIAEEIIATIEKYTPQTETATRGYTAEDDKKIKEKLAAFLNQYNSNVNSGNNNKQF